MILSGSLSVRISDGVADRHVTRYATGLKFTKTAPGGHQSAAVQLNLPRNFFTNLGPASRIWVYDGRNGSTAFEGYVENPTPVDGPEGQRYDISAVGGMALANDETRPLVYLEYGMGEFTRGAASADSSTMDLGDSAAFPGWQRARVQFTRGQAINVSAVSAENNILARAGMSLGALYVTTNSGKADTNYRTSFFHNTAGINIGNTGQMQVSAISNTLWAATDFPSGTTNFISLLLQRVAGGATNIADDTTWTDFVDVRVLGQRMDRNGTLLTGAAGLVSATTVLASQVVEDLLGRLLTFCDPASAQIGATTYAITQLSYPEGIKAAGLLEDLTTFEPDYLWEVLETLSNGKHRFNYRAWPTTPRYIVSTQDGWQQRGLDIDICNRILVSYNDESDKTQSVTVTAASLGLTDPLPGRVKDADPVSLPDGIGSAANATRIGGAILTDKINPPKAGSIVARRPILDLQTGAMVKPWEIEPGYLCRVRETGDDLRITQVDYDHDSGTSVLTLGTPVLTTEQRIAQLSRAA